MENFVSKIEVEINSNCNRKCPWCPNYKFNRPENGEIDINTLKKLFLQLSDMKYDEPGDKWIHPHFYGEPLLAYELLLETIDLAKKILPKIKIKLFTNGDLLDRDKITKLFNKGINYFIVTNHNADSYHSFEELYKTAYYYPT
jgi:MoaA/NifB/PqqE/SkfB family radical SAM enzyme